MHGIFRLCRDSSGIGPGFVPAVFCDKGHYHDCGASADVEKLPVVWPTENDPCHLAHRTIRMIDLMSMSAGLSYDMEAEALKRVKKDSGNQAGTREVVGAIARMPLLYEPGTRWRYSLAHDVLAAVVEAVSGMRFGEYLKANIFEPLEIKDFYFSLDEAQKARLSAFYTVDTDRDVIVPAGEELAETFRVTSNYESGGAGLIGTVDAYSVFADALCNGGVGWNGRAILSGESIRLFSTNYVTGRLLADFKRGGKIGYGYGLGVRVLMDPCTSRSPLGEFGWDGAAGAYVLADPVNHISIFYAQHIMAFQKAYDEIHPKIRDLAYEAMGF